MATDQGPVVQSAVLRGELVRLRKERGMTQERVAARLEWSASKLIRVEGGHSSIAGVDLDVLLEQYGVTSESHRERLRALNRAARETGWWEAYRADAPAAYLTYVAYETGAASIRQFPGTVVPGLLQTPEYAEVLTAISVAPAQVASVVRLRMQRQSELAQREIPPRLYFALDEAVIRRRVGVRQDPAIMSRQLMHIVTRARRDEQVTVRVIPFTAGEHAGLPGPFTLLEFDGGLSDILYLDAGREAISMVASNDRVAEYAESFEQLLAVALSADESVDFIRGAAEELP